MGNLKDLKGKSDYIGISITEDYTPAERDIIKGYRDKAKAMNENNNDNTTVFCVRGTPKNGLIIKKLKKTSQ